MPRAGRIPGDRLSDTSNDLLRGFAVASGSDKQEFIGYGMGNILQNAQAIDREV
jgi:hypothetical protein